jgi:hypothetical protein
MSNTRKVVHSIGTPAALAHAASPSFDEHDIAACGLARRLEAKLHPHHLSQVGHPLADAVGSPVHNTCIG